MKKLKKKQGKMPEQNQPNSKQKELFEKAVKTSQIQEEVKNYFLQAEFSSYEKISFPEHLRLNISFSEKYFPHFADCKRFIHAFCAVSGKLITLNVNNSLDKDLEFYLRTNEKFFEQSLCDCGTYMPDGLVTSDTKIYAVGGKIFFEFSGAMVKENFDENAQFNKVLVGEFGKGKQIVFSVKGKERKIDRKLFNVKPDLRPKEKLFFEKIKSVDCNFDGERDSFAGELMFHILPTFMKFAFGNRLNSFINKQQNVADEDLFVYHNWLCALTYLADKRKDILFQQRGIDFSFENFNMPCPIVGEGYDESFFTFKVYSDLENYDGYMFAISKGEKNTPETFLFSEARFWFYFCFRDKCFYAWEFNSVKEIYNRMKALNADNPERKSFFIEENKSLEKDGETLNVDVINKDNLHLRLPKYSFVDFSDYPNTWPKLVFVKNDNGNFSTKEFELREGLFENEEVSISLAKRLEVNAAAVAASENSIPEMNAAVPAPMQPTPVPQNFQPPVPPPPINNQQNSNAMNSYYQPMFSAPAVQQTGMVASQQQQVEEKVLDFGSRKLNANARNFVEVHNITVPSGDVEIITRGVVFKVDVDKKKTKAGNRDFQIVLIYFTNKKNSIYAKRLADLNINWHPEELVGKEILVSGKVVLDPYLKSNLIELTALNVIGNVKRRVDDAPEKRVELHFHTKMSDQDGTNEVAESVKRIAKEWKHTALAVTDHGVAHGFVETYLTAKKIEGFKPIYGVEAYVYGGDINDVLEVKKAARIKKATKSKKKISELSTVDIKPYDYFHLNILAKNKEGLKNLYELVTESHLKYFYRKPLVSKQMITERRNGLLLGSACERGDVVTAYLAGSSENEIKELIKYYDFIEIMPIDNNLFLIKNGKVKSKEDLKKMNSDLYRLTKEASEELGKEIKVVATSDAHFFDPEDDVYREELLAIKGMMDEQPTDLHLRTTSEMLEEFSYLGQEAVYEVVIANTNAIANQVEELKILPDKLQIPEIPGAAEEVDSIVNTKIVEKYGAQLPKIVSDRLEKEISSIKKYGYEVIYWICMKLVEKSNADGEIVGSRGSVGSSLVAHLLDITELNPLQPHYLCSNCKNSIWEWEGVIDMSSNGRELVPTQCPNCNSVMYGEGDNIPFETFVGFQGEKVPDIDLNFSSDYQETIHKYTEEFLKEWASIYRAGTISTIAERSAIGYAINLKEKKLQRLIYNMHGKPDLANMTTEEKKAAKERYEKFLAPTFKRDHAELYKTVNFHDAELKRLAKGVEGVRKTTGQHPGGLILIPKGDVSNYFPLQHPANDESHGTVTIHFADKVITDFFLKIDALGHDSPRMLKLLKKSTGVDSYNVPLNEPKVLSLFCSTKELKYKRQFEVEVGTLGIPEFGSDFVLGVLKETKPTTITELCLIAGLTHGTDVWNNNARNLVNAGKKLKEVICVRDDIMLYLMRMGLEAEKAFKITELVRKGKKLSEEQVQLMRQNNVPDWYVQSCQKIKYLFPKAHAIAYTLMSLRIAYFKVYHPEHFYAAYLSTKSDVMDAVVLSGNFEMIWSKVYGLREKPGKSANEKVEVVIYNLALECSARGINFQPVDIYKSKARDFIVLDENNILCPFVTVGSLGEKASQKIVEERQISKFDSIDNFKKRCKVNKNVIDHLRRLGTLKEFEVEESSK